MALTRDEIDGGVELDIGGEYEVGGGQAPGHVPVGGRTLARGVLAW